MYFCILWQFKKNLLQHLEGFNYYANCDNAALNAIFFQQRKGPMWEKKVYLFEYNNDTIPPR